MRATGAPPGVLVVPPVVLLPLGGLPSFGRLEIMVPWGFAWPITPDGLAGGTLWLQFGSDSPFGAALIQGPRSFLFGAAGPLGPVTQVPWVMMTNEIPFNSPPSSYAFNVILTDLNGKVAAVLDPLLIVGGVPPGTSPTFPLAHWILTLQTGQPVKDSLPPDATKALRDLGVGLSRGTPSFAPSSDDVACHSAPTPPGLPRLLNLDRDTGELSGPVTAPPGFYCATYDALDSKGKKVAELRILITIPLEVKLSVDRGCGASYQSGDLVTLNYQVSGDAFVTLTLQEPDGSKQVLFTNRQVQGGVPYPFKGKMGETPGERRFILEAVALPGGVTARAECTATGTGTQAELVTLRIRAACEDCAAQPPPLIVPIDVTTSEGSSIRSTPFDLAIALGSPISLVAPPSFNQGDLQLQFRRWAGNNGKTLGESPQLSGMVEGAGDVTAVFVRGAIPPPPGTNQPPRANPGGPYTAAATCVRLPDRTWSCTAPVTLDGGQSRDPDGSVVRYDWDFGDGQSGSGQTVQHPYGFTLPADQPPGPVQRLFKACLTVTDNQGAPSTQQCAIVTITAVVPQQ